jgi:uncharacterized protein
MAKKPAPPRAPGALAEAPARSPEAAFAEACRLIKGDGTKADPNRAMALLEVAASEGHARAGLLLGRLLLSLRGQTARGVHWLRIAAKADLAEASYLLGLAYFRGLGVEADAGEARRLHRLAAEHGDADAQIELSILLDQGLGGPRDPDEARVWEQRAADQGQPRACLNVASRAAHAEPVDWARVVAWYERAAEAGNADAAARLCKMYLVGQGVPRDEERARGWFLVAAALGHNWGAEGIG